MNQPKQERFKTSVGGQALMEGIMMRGPEHICCAVRKPDGTMDIKSTLGRGTVVTLGLPLYHKA